jgi:CRISPR system Cascade subunit CasE
LVVVLVQSLVEPHWKFQTSAVVRVDGPKSLSDVINSISPGERYRFRLRVNPTRRVHRRATTGPDPAKGRLRREKPEAMGKRVELTREADQIEWLRRQAERAGFHIVSVRRLPDWPESKADVPALTASHTWKIRGFKRGTQLSLFSVLFEGVLEITDAEAFRCTLQKGIGPGKAFGCGLLSIAPP